MGRWEPNAQSRLRQAAMDLYAERGFDQTTVAEIAERAGLTERTFFRHFTDKREVLFAGSERLQALLLESVAESPLLPSASPPAAPTSPADPSTAATSPVAAPIPAAASLPAAALAAVAAAFEAAAADYFPPVEYSRQRQRVIDANPALQEREVAKMDRLSAALAGMLRRRGVDDLTAALAAETGTGAFKVAFSRWVADPADGALADHLRAALDALRAMSPSA